MQTGHELVEMAVGHPIVDGLGIAVTALRGPAGHGSVASGHSSPVALSMSAARFSRAWSGSTS